MRAVLCDWNTQKLAAHHTIKSSDDVEKAQLKFNFVFCIPFVVVDSVMARDIPDFVDLVAGWPHHDTTWIQSCN